MSNELITNEEVAPKVTTITRTHRDHKKLGKFIISGVGDNFRIITISLCTLFICVFYYIYLRGYKDETINYLSNLYLTIPLLGGLFGLIRTYPKTVEATEDQFEKADLWLVSKLKNSLKVIRRTILSPIGLFCWGLILWAIGCASYMLYNLFIDKNVGFLLPVEIIYLTCFLLWTLGIVKLYERAGINFIDKANSTVTILIPLWGGIAYLIYLLQSNNSTGGISNDLIKFILNILFPIIDLYNLGLLITLLPTPGNERISIRGKALHLIVLGYLFLCLASTSFTICSSLPEGNKYQYYNGGFTDLMFTIAFTIISFGIFHQIQKDNRLASDA